MRVRTPPSSHVMKGAFCVSMLDSERVRALFERAGLGGLQPRAQLAVLVLAAVAIVFGVWRFWPAAPAPEVAFTEADAVVAAEEAPPDEPEGGEGQTGDTGEPTVVVHVVGAVLHPGVYELPCGSRVVDAVDAAGGALGSAALGSLNLARILSDGEQVYVLTTDEAAAGVTAAGPVAPTPPGAAGQTAGALAGGLIDLNTATAEELDSLPGIGPSTAQKIVSDRETNGPFATPEDLMRVSGIGAAKFEALKDLVTCG